MLTAIIPVYGISRNIGNLIKILNDIPPTIQVIIVHDTTDGEEATLLAQIATAPNIAVLEGAGGTAGKTRNLAFPKIIGPWTVFWDADDRPSPMEILKAISESNSDEIDMIIGSFSNASQNDSDLEATTKISFRENNEMSFLTEFGLWRCIFRSSDIKNVLFNELKIGEDLAFILRAVPKSRRKIYFSRRYVYEYRRNTQGSVTNSQLLKNDFIGAIQAISEIETDGNFKTQFKSQILISLMLSQFRRFPSVRGFLKIAKFCFDNPMAMRNKAREIMNR
jgi:glycosyltransferase involved in cell wall biosynthesis